MIREDNPNEGDQISRGQLSRFVVGRHVVITWREGQQQQ